MRAAHDRILGLALEELLGGETPPDLTERILAAARAPRAPQIRWLRPSLAAAAVLFLAVGAWILMRPAPRPDGPAFPPAQPPRPPAQPPTQPPTQPPPPAPSALATASAALTVVAADGSERKDTRLFEGELALAGEATDLTLADGTVLRAQPGALLSPEGPRLHAGRVRAKDAFLLRTPLGDVRGEEGCEVEVTVRSKADPRAVARGEEPDAESLTLLVLEGAASLDGTKATEGETLRARPGRPLERQRPLSADEKLELDRWMDRITAKAEGLDEEKMKFEAKALMLDFLAQRPEGWAHIRPRLAALPDQGPQRRLLLSVLARAPGAASDEAVLAALRRDLADFDPDSILLLAEGGARPAVAALAMQLARADVMGNSLVPPAAFFALRGDNRGERVLRWFVRDGQNAQKQRDHYLAAAAGLRALGDDIAWNRVVGFMRREVGRALTRNNLSYARWLLAQFQYFQSGFESAEPVGLTDLSRRFARLQKKLQTELAGPEEIRARLRELTD